jgi:hypothetical protein
MIRMVAAMISALWIFVASCSRVVIETEFRESPERSGALYGGRVLRFYRVEPVGNAPEVIDLGVSVYANTSSHTIVGPAYLPVFSFLARAGSIKSVSVFYRRVPTTLRSDISFDVNTARLGSMVNANRAPSRAYCDVCDNPACRGAFVAIPQRQLSITSWRYCNIQIEFDLQGSELDLTFDAGELAVANSTIVPRHPCTFSLNRDGDMSLYSWVTCSAV